MSSKPLQAPTAAAPAGGNTERILADYGRLVRKRTLIVAGLLLLWPIDVRRGREAALRGQG